MAPKGSSTDDLIALLESHSEALEGLGEGGLDAPKRLGHAGGEEDGEDDEEEASDGAVDEDDDDE